MQTLIRFLIGTLIIATSIANPAEKAMPLLSVCDLIANRGKYSGQIVQVRGEVWFGGHGAVLAADGNCQYQLVTRGVVWPNQIYLDYPDRQSRSLEFRADWRSIQKAEDAVKRSGFDRSKDRLTETYVGLFTTYPDLENRVNPGVPGAIRLGFGPTGTGAPAQLLIQSVKDVVVIHGEIIQKAKE